MMIDETIVLSTRLPKKFMPELLAIIQKQGYINISDYLRDLIRRKLEEYRKEEEK